MPRVAIYILELLIENSKMSVAPTFSNSSIILEDSFLDTNADTATAEFKNSMCAMKIKKGLERQSEGEYAR